MERIELFVDAGRALVSWPERKNPGLALDSGWRLWGEAGLEDHSGKSEEAGGDCNGEHVRGKRASSSVSTSAEDKSRNDDEELRQLENSEWEDEDVEK